MYNQPYHIVAGPNGALWFTQGAGGSVLSNLTSLAQISVDGTLTEISLLTLTGQAQEIVAGGRESLWVIEPVGNEIGRITIKRSVIAFPLPLPVRNLSSIAAGPGNDAWFTELHGPGLSGYRGGAIGRIAPDGSITEFPLAPGTQPLGICLGPDNAMWFTDFSTRTIGRIQL